MTELSALVSPHSLTCDHACAFCSYPDAGSGLLQKTSGSWGRCPVPGAPSCCPRSLPLWQATAPSLQHLLFAPLFHHIFQGRYQSHQCLQVHVHQHWPTHFLACFHVGIQGHFKVISKPTHTRHHFAKGVSLLQGWGPGEWPPLTEQTQLRHRKDGASFCHSVPKVIHLVTVFTGPPNRCWDQPLSTPIMATTLV